MNYHMGLLGGPTANNLKWIKQADWHSLPDEIRYDLDVCLSTPGFPNRYWEQVTRRSNGMVTRYLSTLPDSLRDEGLANWHSVTLDDAIKLANATPRGQRNPIVVNIKMVQAIRDGMTIRQAAEVFGMTKANVTKILNQPFGGPDRLPDWFKTLIVGI